TAIIRDPVQVYLAIVRQPTIDGARIGSAARAVTVYSTSIIYCNGNRSIEHTESSMIIERVYRNIRIK
ncbi:MAG: hypothetical protein AB1847_13425, partial [bacterium]